MATKPKRLKNPGVNVFPHMDPAYPIRPLIDTATKQKATIIIVRVPGQKKFVATTLEQPQVNVMATTRKAVQDAAMRAYLALKVRNSADAGEDDQDRRDIALIRKSRKEPRFSWIRSNAKRASKSRIFQDGPETVSRSAKADAKPSWKKD